MTTTKLLTTFACVAFSLTAIRADVTVPGLKREYYPGLDRPTLEAGTTTAPASVTALPTFEAPINVADNYAQRVSGFFTPASDGNYVFFLASDDDGDLFLSTDATPANKKLIAQEVSGGWSASRAWNTANAPAVSTDVRSDSFAASEWPTPNTIALKKGVAYYIEAVEHEGGGGDNLAVYIKKDTDADPTDGDAPSAAGGAFTFSAPTATSSITTQPTSATVTEGKNAILSVAATTTSQFGISYQWKKGGTAIAGATKPTYTIPVQQLGDTGAKYTVVVSSAGAPDIESSAATITVVADTTPPVLVSAGSLKTFAGGTEVGLLFDEALTGSSTSALSNYTINNGATITAARYVTNSSGLDTFQQGVILTVTGVTPGSSYTVTAKGVADAKGNAIATAQSATFTASNLSWVGIGTENNANGAQDNAFAVATNSFNLVNGGSAFWGTQDDITMVYEPITGDFDRVTQVEWNDPSSNWARAGISARESLNNGQATTDAAGANPASRYQMIISDPVTKYDGTGANDQYETNRRLNVGGATDSHNAAGPVSYPNSFVRLKRVGQRITTFRSVDGNTWHAIGTTDFGDTPMAPEPTDPISTDGPLKDQLFVGPTLGVENGNITDPDANATDDEKAAYLAAHRGAFAARFRNYGAPAQKARGTQTYAVGLSFGANEEGAQLSATDVAGADAVAQSNWNNIFGNDTSATPAGPIVADKGGVSTSTGVTVDVSGSGNTWASQGPRGENNSQMVGNDTVLMTGYLDTGNATTTQVAIGNIPSDLTSAGYDVVVYALGGVGARGGSYRVTDASGAVLSGYVAVNGAVNPTAYTRVGSDSANPTNGNYIVFKGLKAPSIIVEATTDNGLGTGGTPRAPINAIQLVTPSGLADGGTSTGGQPKLSIAVAGTSVTISSDTAGTTVQASDKLGTGANWQGIGTAPQTVPAGAGNRFFRGTK
jgi:hypothetical protein